MTEAWLAELGDDAARGLGIANLPYGVFSTDDRGRRRTGVAIGERVLDLAGLTGDTVHATGSLNAFLARGRPAWDALRSELTRLLTDPAERATVRPHLLPRDAVTLHLPVEVADYVDFYSSRAHAENAGRIIRPGGEPLPPNWLHLPVGYHGRAGTVRPSGTPVLRPSGQLREPGRAAPSFGPARCLDFEAELGFVVGAPSPAGRPVPVDAFADHVFGVCLVNDWSARDIQFWESAPLGPFLGKSFLTSVSPWVVPLAALDRARTSPPERAVPLLPYLRDGAPWALDITLEVRLNGHLISTPPAAELYFTGAQQLAHLTVNGASLRTGDLFASGTVSGTRRDQRGCLLELAWHGADPLELPDGSTRCYLEDGDTVSIAASAPATDGGVLRFGEVTGTVRSA